VLQTECPAHDGTITSDPFGDGIVECAACGCRYHAGCALMWDVLGCAQCGVLPFLTRRTASPGATRRVPAAPAPNVAMRGPRTVNVPVRIGHGYTTVARSRSATAIGWCAGILLCFIAYITCLAPLVATMSGSPRGQLLISVATTWLLCSTTCVGIMTSRAICGRSVIRALQVLFISSMIAAVVIASSLHNVSKPTSGQSQESGLLVLPRRIEGSSLRTQLLNASYPSACDKVFSDVGFESPIPLQNGEWDNGQPDPVQHAYFGIIGKKIIFANLTRDGHREAVVPTACGIYASTEAYTEVFVIDISSPALTVLARLSPEDWGDNSRGITYIWNTSDVRVANGLLLVSFELGGSHAQPDWDATSGFRWDGSRFVRVGFEAHGETAGAHPNEVIQEGTDLHSATDQGTEAVTANPSATESVNGQEGVGRASSQPVTQSGAPSNPEAETGEAPSTFSSANLSGSQQSDQPSTTTATPPSATGGIQLSGATQAPSGPPGFTVRQWVALAERQFKADNFNGALQSCDAALRIDPQSVDALRLKGKVEKTMAILSVPVTAQTPSVPPTRTVQQWLALAESQFEGDDFKGALQSCNAALQIDPQNAQAMQLKGKLTATMKVLGGNQ
jgi:hypothetical protein